MQLKRQIQDTGEFCIDTLTFSLDLCVLADGVERFTDFECLVSSLEETRGNDFTLLSNLRRLAKKLFPRDSIELETDIRGLRNFYANHVRFKDACGYIAFGGNNTYVDKEGAEVSARERLTVHLTGEGCRRVFDFHYLYEQIFALSDYSPVITRLDIAFDDHQGSRGIEFCKGLYESGAFVSSGRPPKARFLDDMGSGEGCTFYVGKKQNGKELCVYEKGKQLGEAGSDWVRWEGRIYAQDRVIPLDALITFEVYLVGMYPALGFMGKVAKKIQTSKKKAEIQLEHLKKHARIAYGPLIYFLRARGLRDDQIINELINTGSFPARLTWTASTHSLDPFDLTQPTFLDPAKTHKHLFEVQTC